MSAQLGLGVGEVRGSAELSPCGNYRYLLERHWDDSLKPVAFVMLNPSTADADTDDPTIRRCMAFARSWGAGGLLAVNLFAFRSTDPDALETVDDPIGPGNNHAIVRAVERTSLVVAGWGAHEVRGNRDGYVQWLVESVDGGQFFCLGTTKDGHPRHPLYVRADTRPIPWESPAVSPVGACTGRSE